MKDRPEYKMTRHLQRAPARLEYLHTPRVPMYGGLRVPADRPITENADEKNTDAEQEPISLKFLSGGVIGGKYSCLCAEAGRFRIQRFGFESPRDLYQV